MGIYLGIDGGATKTACVVADETRVLALVTGRGCNIVRHGEQKARQALTETILSGCKEAGVDPKTVGSSCIGAAGASIAESRECLRRIVGEVAAGRVSVVADSEIALEAAVGGHGVVVASGTGSIAFGRNETGVTARAGGHGCAISDEGSGYWIGKAAIAAVLRRHDRGEAPTLLSELAKAWGGTGRDDLVKTANGTPAPEFATLFPVVAEAGRRGDSVATEVLNSAGEHLAELATIVMSRLWTDDRKIQVGVVGSVFRHSEIMLRTFSSAVVRLDQRAEVSQSISEPVFGALSLARRGWKDGSGRE